MQPGQVKQAMEENNDLIEALLTLLDDEDDVIAGSAQKKLRELGHDAIPEIEEHLQDQPLKVKLRAREVMSQLQPSGLEEDFRSLPQLENGDLDLEEGMFTLARLAYPSLQTEPYRTELDEIADQLGEALNRWDARDAHTTVEIVNNVIFEQLGFHGNSENYYDENNSFINQILERRTGIPISLSAVILLIAERLDLPYRGIGMPAHFLLRYDDPDHGETIFIDAFNQGKKLGKRDCVEFLSRTGFGFIKEYLEPVSNQEILSRFIRNLIKVYSRKQLPDRVQELRRYLTILDHQF